MEPSPETVNDPYSGVLERIYKFMLVLGAAAVGTAFAMLGWRIAVGFAVGGAVSFLNFYWLKKVVAGVAAAAVRSGTASGRRVVQRFLLRYFLMAMAAFVILTVSRDSLYGFFAGLFLPAAAMLCEAGYETYNVVRRR